LPIEFDLEDDWVRHKNKEYQNEIQENILLLYKKYNVQYIEITWTIQERIEKILFYINEKNDTKI
jgi:hypothetical protein